jgi:hypothetical protein
MQYACQDIFLYGPQGTSKLVCMVTTLIQKCIFFVFLRAISSHACICMCLRKQPSRICVLYVLILTLTHAWPSCVCICTCSHSQLHTRCLAEYLFIRVDKNTRTYTQAKTLSLTHTYTHIMAGCGKTLIARLISQALQSRPPKIVNGPELLDKWVGEAERNVRALFFDAER